MKRIFFGAQAALQPAPAGAEPTVDIVFIAGIDGAPVIRSDSQAGPGHAG